MQRVNRGHVMSAIVFVTDQDYLDWLQQHPQGFVVNASQSLSPDYMVLHRSSCPHISQPTHESEPGGFTERGYIKVGAASVEALRDWVAEYGRPNRTFSKECA